MTEHVTEWLGAYHDGELSGARLHQVEQHLAGCAACQASLDELRSLSALLHEPAPEGNFLPAERFVANLALSLPRQAAQTQPRSVFNAGWYLAPVGLLAVGLFIEIMRLLSSALTFALDSGLFNGDLAWLQGDSSEMTWFAAAMNLFGGQLGAVGQQALAALNEANVFVVQLAARLLPQLILAAAYLGWMLAWWLRQQDQPAQNGEISPQV